MSVTTRGESFGIKGKSVSQRRSNNAWSWAMQAAHPPRSATAAKPDVPLTEIPTFFLYLGCWFLMTGVVYYFFGLETRGKTFEEIDRDLAAAK